MTERRMTRQVTVRGILSDHRRASVIACRGPSYSSRVAVKCKPVVLAGRLSADSTTDVFIAPQIVQESDCAMDCAYHPASLSGAHRLNT